jgi:hypothetical protein
MALAWAGLLIATPMVASASELSELLVAKGQVAYNDGRYDEARQLFEQAVDADPRDATANYDLGLAFLALTRWDEAARSFEAALAVRPDMEEAQRALALAHERGRAPVTAAETKRWEMHAATGVGYDTNVKVAPGGNVVPGVGRRGDTQFVFAVGGHYDLLSLSNALLRLDYDYYQTLHPHLSDFNFQSHRVRGTASYALTSAVWAGVQGGYNYYGLGSESYLNEPFVMPFTSILEGGWGLTQLSYRYGADTYLQAPFHDVRDGPTDTVGIDQTVYLPEGRGLSFGYLFTAENPTSQVGNDWELRANQVYAGISSPLWWSVTGDLTFLYRHDDYPKPNSFADFETNRVDNEYHLAVGFRRPITDHLFAVFTYYYTIDNSNIDIFSYSRNIVTGMLEVTY